MDKRILIPTIFLTFVALGGIYLSKNVLAQGQENYPSIIQKLVERFNLNKDDVQQVFNEVRSERQQQMQNRFEERLNQAIASGQITEDQKSLILAKQEELRNQKQEDLQNWQNLTPEQKKEQMQNQRTELQNWAESNGIDLKYFFGLEHGFKDGHFRGMGYFNDDK